MECKRVYFVVVATELLTLKKRYKQANKNDWRKPHPNWREKQTQLKGTLVLLVDCKFVQYHL